MFNTDPKNVISWIEHYFLYNGPDSNAVIGISGGKDSTVAAKLCAEALGPEKVICVKMPQGQQHDIDVANEVIKYLGIPERNVYEINIGSICMEAYKMLDGNAVALTPQVTSNLPARIRMTILYAIAAARGGRVVNTCNYSEDYVGYSTKYGDSAGDFSPLGGMTVTQVLELGHNLGIPEKFLKKPPEDGLSGKTDEENLGFTYEVLDAYLSTHEPPEYEIFKNIEQRHARNMHKVKRMPTFADKFREDYEF